MLNMIVNTIMGGFFGCNGSNDGKGTYRDRTNNIQIFAGLSWRIRYALGPFTLAE